MKGKVLITGGSGFVGSHLNARLKKEGFETVVMDIVPSPGYVFGDVRDFSADKKLSDGVDTIFHLAGELPPHGWKKGKKGDMWDIMVNGTENVLRAALENSVKKVVHFSSSAVYGIPTAEKIRENAPKNPLDEYGKSKLRSEEICRKYMDEGLDVTIVRPTVILGDKFVGVLRLMMEFIYLGKKVYMIGDGSNRIQLVHIDDVINACMLILKSEESKGEAFNIAADNTPMLRENLAELIKHAGTNSKLVPLPKVLVKTTLMIARSVGLPAVGKEFYSLGGKTLQFLDTEKAREILGWKPEREGVEGLKDAYDWYSKNRDVARPVTNTLMKIVLALS